MAIIYTYPTKAAAAADLVLISDSADENKTKNASISSIRDAIDVVDVISAGPGISVSNPTGNVTIGNTGVLSLIAGSNISLSASTGNITISTSASNVDGSGTTNSIPKWTDSNTLGDSQIFQLGTDIGIGTTTPAKKLDVNGDITFGTVNKFQTTTNALEGLGTNGAIIRSFSSTAAKPSFSNRDDQNTGMFLPGSDVIGFTTNASEKMRIGSNGDVGIGTSFPFEKLQVAGKIRVDGTGANSLQLFRNSTLESNYIEFYDKFSLASEALVGYTDLAGGEFKIYNAKATSTEFFTSGLQRMVITGSGNIGIGTSSPPTKMAIADNAPALRFINTSGTNNSYYMNVGMFSGQARIDSFTNTNGSAPLYFATGGSNRMQLSATGNLSIGPFPGTEKLNVDGTVDLTNLKVSGVQGNSGDVLTSSGTGVSWAPGGGGSVDSWTAGCASVGSSSNIASNPRQASFTFPNEVGSSNFGPCIPIGADMDITNVNIKWNGSNAPTIGASGTVDFKLGKLTNPSGNPDTQEGTVNYTNIGDLTGLQITSADSGTWIYKSYAPTGLSVAKGDVMVILFPRPTVGWTGTGATNGDLQLTMVVSYT